MDKSEITLFTGEGLVDFVDRLGFALMEIGVKFKVAHLHDDYVTFEFTKAERLDEEDGKKES